MTEHPDSRTPLTNAPFLRLGTELPPDAKPGDLFVLEEPGTAGVVHTWSQSRGWLRLERRSPVLDDAALAQMARQAGLCLTRCWDIDLMLEPGSVEDDQRWIAEAANAKERRRRQESVETMHRRAGEMLQKLRCFAELVQNHSHAG